MRTRIILGSAALGIAAAFLSAPVAFAEAQPSSNVPTSPAAPSPAATTAPPEATTSPGATPSRPVPSTKKPDRGDRLPTATPGQVEVKPRGGADTGAGMTDEGFGTGAVVWGAVALLGTAGVGTVAYRRVRRQG